MPLALPSEADEWIDEYRKRLNESAAYSEAGDGWGVGFDGDFLFEIRPDDAYDGDPVYLFVGVADGSCHAARQVADPGEKDWGFAFRGDYSDWKRLIRGEIHPIEGTMGGTFDLDGDMQKVLQYSSAAVVMTETAGEVPTEFEY